MVVTRAPGALVARCGCGGGLLLHDNPLAWFPSVERIPLMKHLRRSPLVAALVLAFAPQFAQSAALTPLPQEQHINTSLMAGVVGDEIRRNCPTISARLLVAWFKLEGLKRYALKKGYKRDEVRAFIKSKVQKKRIHALAERYMAAHGVKPGDSASYCRLGEAEIARHSLIGALLWKK